MKIRDLLIEHPDGSYEPKKTVIISSPSGKVSLNPGVRFRRGVRFMGIDITEVLDKEVIEGQ